MFYTGLIKIDPKQVTVITEIDHSDILMKLYNSYNKENVSKQEEHETFTVIQILEQIRSGLNQIGLNNLISLHVDNNNFYMDNSASDNDLDEAINKIHEDVGPLEASFFDTVVLALEHFDDDFKYLVEIRIDRRHVVGEFPIKLTVNGFLKELYWQDDKSFDIVFDEIDNIFSNQSQYDNYVKSYSEKFQSFMNILSKSLSDFISVDGYEHELYENVIVPEFDINSLEEVQANTKSEPIFHNYAMINHYTFYCYKWNFFYDKNDIVINPETRKFSETGELLSS